MVHFANNSYFVRLSSEVKVLNTDKHQDSSSLLNKYVHVQEEQHM